MGGCSVVGVVVDGRSVSVAVVVGGMMHGMVRLADVGAGRARRRGPCARLFHEQKTYVSAIWSDPYI